MTRRGTIDNPILNSPFEEPARHFQLTEEGITDKVLLGRRPSSFTVPVPKARKQGKQVALEFETKEKREESKLINKLRDVVKTWRDGGSLQFVTVPTRQLLEHWRRGDRDNPLYFCQLEAVESAIYLVEVAGKVGQKEWIDTWLNTASAEHNPTLTRIAFKMATGSGKTMVMAMLIAWQTLNALANKKSSHYARNFLVVAPGITIRDRLQVLQPEHYANVYEKYDLVPRELLDRVKQARVVITNYHAFLQRETVEAAGLTKKILIQGQAESPFTESPKEMAARICRDFPGRERIAVLNDEAHHCYRGKPASPEAEALKGDDRKEAQEREREARVWLSGLEAIRSLRTIVNVYDLSATPSFLKGSGYPEGTLFPWVVSDFSLTDAIEAGIVKVPRVPINDNAMVSDTPVYRDLWPHIRDELPKKGARKENDEPKLPPALEGALAELYGKYETYFNDWQKSAGELERMETPPVFIVVCNNTTVSKLVFDYIAGWKKTLPQGGSTWIPGKLKLFSNVEHNQLLARPNSIVVDSAQLDSGSAMTDEFKAAASSEITAFKRSYARQHGAVAAGKLTDEDLLREVLNTVGKKGQLGEHIRCVISVSMLTEGWDTTTVTHILGVRAFGSQLLCEQVVGRGLRRISHKLDGDKHFIREDAEVYGVPFEYVPCAAATGKAPEMPPRRRVRALPERKKGCEIRFPRVVGYRFELPEDDLPSHFDENSVLELSTERTPTRVEDASLIGDVKVHDLHSLRARRVQEVEFHVAREVMQRFFRDDAGNIKAWLFPQVLGIARAWLKTSLKTKDDTFPQLLLWGAYARDAAEKVHQAIARGAQKRTGQESYVLPVLSPYNTVGSTAAVDFETSKPLFATHEHKSHVSHVVADTNAWEQKLAQSLEEMDEVTSYVKNQGLGFYIPYTFQGTERRYIPDFIARVDNGAEKRLHVIIEVTGFKRPDKELKVATARTSWVPAINRHGGFGDWAFVEVTDVANAKSQIRRALGLKIPAGESLFAEA